MNKIGVIFIVIILMIGCVSSEFKQSVRKQAVRNDNMIAQINSGNTTRLQEQSYIRAMRILIHVWNNDLNDVKLPHDVFTILNYLKNTSETPNSSRE